MAYGFNNDKSRADMPTLTEFNQLKATVNALVNAIFPLVSRVGTIGEQIAANVSYANAIQVPTFDSQGNSNRTVVALHLPKGVWLVQGEGKFKRSSTDGVCMCKQSTITDDARTLLGQLSQTIVDAETNTYITVTNVFILDEPTDVYLICWHNTGNTIPCWGEMIATRLAPDVAGEGDTAPLDYNLLSNKPLIENVTLLGNKTFEELGLTGGENISFNNATISSPQMTSAEAAAILNDE